MNIYLDIPLFFLGLLATVLAFLILVLIIRWIFRINTIVDHLQRLTEQNQVLQNILVTQYHEIMKMDRMKPKGPIDSKSLLEKIHKNKPKIDDQA